MGVDMRERIDHAIRKWELDHVNVVYEHLEKGVFSAESKKFGSVILKIGRHRQQLEAEYKMLERLSGHYSCKAYAFDAEAGLLWRNELFRGRHCAGKCL